MSRMRVGVRGGALHGLRYRPAQRVVGGGEVVAAAVPGADGLSGHVVQHPARAGFHTELMDAVAEHVVGVTHDDTLLDCTRRQVIERQLTLVAHGALVAFDVQLDAGGEADFGAVEIVAGADDAVARQRQEGTAERIEMCSGRCVGMGCGALGGIAFVLAQGVADALRVPGLPGGGLSTEIRRHIALDVRVGARVASLGVAWTAGVIDVVGGLLPWVEHYLLERVVRVQGGDDALGRVVEQHRADANHDAKLEVMRGAEERLVLADRLALVVEDGPAAANPAWIHHKPAFDH